MAGLGRDLRTAVIAIVAMTVVLGLAYPLAITGAAQVLFPGSANGSKVELDGRVVGSRLIGQEFRGRGYFHSRPSATATPYDAANSAGSNYGPTNTKLIDEVTARVAARRAENPSAPVPVDLVTTSASGFDPHITPAAAAFQAPRVATARGLPLGDVQALIARHTEGRTLGLLGEPRVNVLELNLALDAQFPLAAPTGH